VKHIFLWPAQASEYAGRVDLLIASFGAMVWLLTLPVFILGLVFVLRYRSGRDVNREHRPTHNLKLELAWSGIPFLLAICFYVWATSLYLDEQVPPKNAVTINVVAKQWMWKFQHPEGAREINELHVPVGVPMRLVMTSQDVIHSLYLPALRIKQDVVPGRYTWLWFDANRTGSYPLRCAEYCGANHSLMVGSLVVMNRADYAKWLDERGKRGGGQTLAQQGAELFRTSGCTVCHVREGRLAPDLNGIFGREVSLADGSTVRADEQYLRDSILLPRKQVVAGFKPIMPSFVTSFDPEQLNALIAYLKSNQQETGR
jgi:cytochrome c oxidase subunit 2